MFLLAPFRQRMAQGRVLFPDRVTMLPRIETSINRFTILLRAQSAICRIGLERMLNVKRSDYGYQFYQTPVKRMEPIKKLREGLLTGDPDSKPAAR